MLLACDQCHKTIPEMNWLEQIIVKAESEDSSKGSIYMGHLDGAVVIVYQPLIMSCLACLVYDCEGNRLSLNAQQQESVVNIMSMENKIFSSVE
jgi:hypothetical protein